MSTATLANDARRNGVALFAAPAGNKPPFKMKRKAAGAGKELLSIEKMPVFRSGTFRDSMGYQHTWEDLHIQQMVTHFSHLRNKGILPHVPVRKGHPGFLTSGNDIMDAVLGYHNALTAEMQVNEVDGKDYMYLLADYEILGPPDAIDAIESGRWRNMSSEVGTWISNDEAEYWPVYQGVAYVDFSAVEGLKNYSSAQGVGSKFSIMVMDKENEVTAPAPGQTQNPPPLPPAPPAAQPQNQNPAPAPTPAPEQHANGTPVPGQATGGTTTEFSLVSGTKITEPAAVQAELTRLGTFEQEVRTSGRKLFVQGLVDGNKLLVANQKDTEDFCLGLSDQQFEAYRKQWETVPQAPQFAGQGVQGTSNQTGSQAGGQPQGGGQGDEFTQALGVVNQLKLSGLKVEQIMKTPSYEKLKAAGKAPF